MKVGDKVRAFHPRMMGVVKEGHVVAIGRTAARIDFGVLLGGTMSVSLRDVLTPEGEPVSHGFRRGL